MKTRLDQLLYLTPDQTPEEWSFAWAGLARLGFDVDLRDESGEVWQYMDTCRDNGGQLWHEFRHRFYTPAQKRVYARVRASDDYQTAHPAPKPEPPAPLPPVRPVWDCPAFDERDCSGAFDGITVTSDADPGL